MLTPWILHANPMLKSCNPYTFFYLLILASCFLTLLSCFLPLVSHFLSLASCLSLLVSHFLSLVPYPYLLLTTNPKFFPKSQQIHNPFKKLAHYMRNTQTINTTENK